MGANAGTETPPAGITRTEILDHLARVLSSSEFEHSDRSRPLLKFLVETALGGRSTDLKETVIGNQVFGRTAGYSPREDPVVRVGVGRLRLKLDKYYWREGSLDAVQIRIPKGSYVPLFERTQPGHVTATAIPRSLNTRTIRILVSMAGAVTIVIATIWITRPPARPSLDHLRPFSSQGTPNNPVFSPSGTILAFDAQAQSDRNRNIYVQRLDAASSTRLSDDSATERCPAWSPDGTQIAFLRELSADAYGIYTMPAAGGARHKIADLRKGAAPGLAWSEDGKWLAVAEPYDQHTPGLLLVDPRTGVKRPLTAPPANWRGDSLPSFSTDSKTIYFRRTGVLSGHEDIYSVPVAGGPVRQLTFDGRGVAGFAALPNGGMVISSRRSGYIRSLWWRPPNGPMERLTPSTVDAGPPAASRDRKHFAFVNYSFDVNIWSVRADGGAPAQVLIDSDLPDSSPQYSPDGSRLAFDSVRTGTMAIWVSNASGSRPILLVDGKGFDIGNESWSPDGRRLAFEWWLSGKPGIYLVGSEGGEVRPLAADSWTNGVPVWSHDGAFIYFKSNRSGRPEIWRTGVQGGTPVQITANGAVSAKLSPNGQTLYYMNFQTPREIWQIPLREGLAAGEPSRVLTGLTSADWADWVPNATGIYYLRRYPVQPPEIRYHWFDGKEPWTVWSMTKKPAEGGGMTLSPDGQTLLFTQVDRESSSIYVQ